jgi:hypothetical protein
VGSGTLLVNGSLSGTSGVTVASGATLGGSGSVSGSVTSSGTIAPGDGIGTLTIGTFNSLTLSDASSLAFQIGAGANHDLINVGTDVNLPATGQVTVNLTNAGGMGAGTIPLIDYTGTLNGSFSTLALGTQPSGFTYSLINNTANTSIDLQITAAPGLPGDYNNNGSVDAADYVLWRNGGPLVNEVADVGTVSPQDYTEWRSRFGNTGSGSGLGGPAVPEPTALVLLALGFGGGLARLRSPGRESNRY